MFLVVSIYSARFSLQDEGADAGKEAAEAAPADAPEVCMRGVEPFNV